MRQNITDSYRNIKLVPPEDDEYVAFMGRMADKRPSRGGPRAAGEYLGGVVELAVRHWLSQIVALQPERILTWEQRLRNGRHGTLYRELDAVWQIDDVSLCLFEMKLTTSEHMEDGSGIRQLNIASDILFESKKYDYILKRLVYVAEEQVPVLEDLPVLEPNDEYAELGVIWVPPSEVIKAAGELELDLPEDWLLPESREGFLEDPEREEWRQYANTEAVDPESNEPDPNSPMAEALKRLLEKKS